MLLDTCFVIDLQREALRRQPGAAFRFLESRRALPLRISAVTYGELAEGFTPERREAFREVVRPYDVVPVNEEISWHYGQVPRELRAAGARFGDNDLWIAATALSLDAGLVTRDTEHFARVLGLSVIAY